MEKFQEIIFGNEPEGKFGQKGKHKRQATGYFVPRLAYKQIIFNKGKKNGNYNGIAAVLHGMMQVWNDMEWIWIVIWNEMDLNFQKKIANYFGDKFEI